MTVAFEEKAVLEFKGRMLMMTVLLLKDLDPNTLHRPVTASTSIEYTSGPGCTFMYTSISP